MVKESALDDNLSYIAREFKGRKEISDRDIEKIINGSSELEILLQQSNDIFEKEKIHAINERDPTQQQLFRESIMDIIKDLHGVSIDYERLKYDSVQIVKGSKVRIKKDSEYYSQNKGIGTIQGDFGSQGVNSRGSWAKVIFEDGYKNAYRASDLEPIIDKITQTENSLYNKRILEKTSELPFDKFKEDLNIQLRKYLEKNNKDLIEVKDRKFKVGELIVMDKGASQEYTLTKEGSEGKIIEDSGFGKYKVYFTKQTGDLNRKNEEWVVHKDFMSKKKTLSEIVCEKENPEQYFNEIIEESINSAISIRVKEKLKQQNINKLKEILIKKGLLINQGKSLVVSQNGIFKYIAPRLALAYSDNRLYSSQDMFSPPSERQPHVLRLELTTGCDYKKCTYCDGYKGIGSTEKSYDEFIENYKKILEVLGDYKSNIKRIFIGGGNALSADQETLKKVIDRVSADFNPKRISTYGRADAIINKGKENLIDLKRHGLKLVYWGIESGADSVLDYVNKGITRDQMLTAGEIAYNSNLELSVMIMPGLGGIRYYHDHVKETAYLLNNIDAKFITLMAINASPCTRYAKKMQKEIEIGTNRHLSDHEIVKQVKEILELIKPKGQKIGMFDCGVDQVGKNPIAFNSEFGYSGKSMVLNILEEHLSK